MRRCLLAALAVLFPSLAWAADVPSLPAATTLSGATIYIANGGAQDNSSGFSTGIFCISGGNIILCNGGITAAMLASTTGSGSTVVLSAGPTISGSPTFSGTPIMSGLSAGTIVTNKFIGLDSGNNMVLGAGGGLSGTLTHGHTLVGNGSDVATDTSLTGDLGCGTSSGGFSTCVVTGFQGRAFASTAPTNGQAIVWDNVGLTWKPGTVSGGGGCATAGSATQVLTDNGSGGCTSNATTLASGVLHVGDSVYTSAAVGGSAGPSTVNTGAYYVNGQLLGSTVAGTTGNIAVAAWNAGATYVVTSASQTLTLLASTGYSPNAGVCLLTVNQSVTLALANAGDAINGGTAGASVSIGAHLLSCVSTDAAGNFQVSPTKTPLNVSDTGQVLTGGVHPTAFNNGTASSGTKTIDCGNGPIQSLTNGGAFTFTMSANDGECTVRITNNGSAGTITFSGFSQGSNSGDPLNNTNSNKFDIVLTRIAGNPHYLVTALQP